ncbi:MAG: M24 family metallopeptidase [Bacilli bacterium]
MHKEENSPAAIFRERVKKLRTEMQEQEIDAVLLLKPENQFYITGFRALTYSRPIATIVTETKVRMVVPGLEEVHAHLATIVDDVLVYYEHPEKCANGAKSFYGIINKLFSDLSIGRVGFEDMFAPYSAINSLSINGIGISTFLARMRQIKDEEELSSLRAAGAVVSGAVQATLQTVRAGNSELEVEDAGNRYILESVSGAYANATLSLTTMTPSGLVRSVMPHVLSSTRRLQSSDIGIHSRQAALNGYRAECERTFFVGKPNASQVSLFQVMVEAKQAAQQKCFPGTTLREIDSAARSVVQRAGYGDYFVHRTGHGIGLDEHETPAFGHIHYHPKRSRTDYRSSRITGGTCFLTTAWDRRHQQS